MRAIQQDQMGEKPVEPGEFDWARLSMTELVELETSADPGRARAAVQEVVNRLENLSLQELISLMTAAGPRVKAAIQEELYCRTSRFVAVLVHERRPPRLASQLTSNWLINAAEKSFLSYVSKKDKWEKGVPSDAQVRAMLRTIVKRVLAREIDALNRQAVATVDAAEEWVDPRDTLGEAEFLVFCDELRSALNECDENAAKVLELLLKGHTQTEIAQILEVGRGTVWRLLQAIKPKLAPLLAAR